MKHAISFRTIMTGFVVMLYPLMSIRGETFVVTNTNDTGDGSFREAIKSANASVEADTVVFQIPAGDGGYDAGTGTWTIQPATGFWAFSDDATLIDGNSQKEFIGGDSNPDGPEIVISGIGSGIYSGFHFQGNQCELQHIAIAGFEVQILITGENNRITGCYVGMDPTGVKTVEGSYTGIMFDYQAQNNIIGGETDEESNLISGNSSNGIHFYRQSAYNTIVNNLIGTDRTGTVSLRNGRGVFIENGSHHNTIGGGNVICGNTNWGVYIGGTDTDYNIITGNFIGVDFTGDAALGNGQSGIYLTDGPDHTMIGGTEPGEGNVISGNDCGVEMRGEGTSENTVAGNTIGLSATGSIAVENEMGVYLRAGTQHNIIGPSNVISGNTSWGIRIVDENTAFNTVVGNLIGTNPDGSMAMANGTGGVHIYYGAGQNTIGGTEAGESNVISGNGEYGIFLAGSGLVVEGNRILGNLIGTDATGLFDLPNGSNGISLYYSDVVNTTIGGEEEAAQNVISGNEGSGIYMVGSNVTGNTILGNIIGMDVSAENPLPNQNNGIQITNGPANNTVGPGNTIAYNEWNGIIIQDADCIGNTITQNSIFANHYFGINLINDASGGIAAPEITGLGSVLGTASPNARVEIFTGPDDEGKEYQGFVLADGVGNFTFPGSPEGPYITATATDAAGNTSGFSDPFHVGAFVVTTTADTVDGSLHRAIEEANIAAGPDTIIFNIPLTDANYNTGSGVWTFLPQTRLPEIVDDGTVIDGFSQAVFQASDTNPYGPEIEIDGSLLTTGHACFYILANNVTLSGLAINNFNTYGIYTENSDSIHVTGCYVGTDPTGTTAKPNGWGLVAKTCSYGYIGPFEDHASIISGNKNVGIALDDTSMHNVVTGSIIGLDRTMSETLGNGNYGAIRLFVRSDGNEIVDNIIAGNRWGIYVHESGENTIVDNLIGTDDVWSEDIGNMDCGINITADTDSANGNVIQNNRIGFNETYGVRVYGSMCQRNTITENSISRNGWSGILVTSGANADIAFPEITHASQTVVRGTAGANQKIEVFADEDNQGREYLGFVDADGTGAWELNLAPPPSFVNITATATDASGNTSAFSDAYITSDVAEKDDRLPDAFGLSQNYPNPFNPETTIGFDVKEKSMVSLQIYDVRGRVVATLVDEIREAGSYRVRFDASGLPSGIYLYRIRMKDSSTGAGTHFTDVKKMIVLE